MVFEPSIPINVFEVPKTLVVAPDTVVKEPLTPMVVLVEPYRDTIMLFIVYISGMMTVESEFIPEFVPSTYLYIT
jgi:hypothetical protein